VRLAAPGRLWARPLHRNMIVNRTVWGVKFWDMSDILFTAKVDILSINAVGVPALLTFRVVHFKVLYGKSDTDLDRMSSTSPCM
jgi:hypothetical protein